MARAADSIKTIQDYIECCVVKGSCFGCPFYLEGTDYLNNRCMGTKQYGGLLLNALEDIKKEIKHGKEKRKP